MNDDHILAAYEDLSLVTRQMVGAARERDWERLAMLEKECSARFQALLAAEDGCNRDSAFQRRKAALIRRVLDDDAEIRIIAEPWLERLNALIGTTRRRNRLNAAYRLDD